MQKLLHVAFIILWPYLQYNEKDPTELKVPSGDFARLLLYQTFPNSVHCFVAELILFLNMCMHIFIENST